jgi:hypothetical protein
LPSIIVEKSELFVSLKLAVRMLNSSFKDISGVDELTLRDYLTTYIEVHGIYNIFPPSDNTKSFKPQFLKGLCTAEYFKICGEDAFGMITEDCPTDAPCIVKTSIYTTWENPTGAQEISVKPCGQVLTNEHLTNCSMVRARDLGQFIEETNIPIYEECFVLFFEEAELVNTEQFFMDLDKEKDKESSLRTNYFFNELIEAFGRKHAEMIDGSTDIAIAAILHTIEERRLIAERTKKLVKAMEDRDKKPEIKKTAYNDEDIPDLLYFAYDLFCEVWRDLPLNMNKPSRDQLVQLLRTKGIKEPSFIQAVIKVSTPNDVVLGARKKSDFVDWKPKGQRI